MGYTFNGPLCTKERMQGSRKACNIMIHAVDGCKKLVHTRVLVYTSVLKKALTLAPKHMRRAAHLLSMCVNAKRTEA